MTDPAPGDRVQVPRGSPRVGLLLVRTGTMLGIVAKVFGSKPVVFRGGRPLIDSKTGRVVMTPYRQPPFTGPGLAGCAWFGEN